MCQVHDEPQPVHVEPQSFAKVLRDDEYDETPLRSNADPCCEVAVCWIPNHDVVEVLDVLMAGSVKLARVRTSENHEGYIKYQHIKPESRRALPVASSAMVRA